MTTATQPVRPTTAADLAELVGTELGPTPWYSVEQDRVNAFADATDDHQWIHLDTERAAARTATAPGLRRQRRRDDDHREQHEEDAGRGADG